MKKILMLFILTLTTILCKCQCIGIGLHKKDIIIKNKYDTIVNKGNSSLGYYIQYTKTTNGSSAFYTYMFDSNNICYNESITPKNNGSLDTWKTIFDKEGISLPLPAHENTQIKTRWNYTLKNNSVLQIDLLYVEPEEQWAFIITNKHQ